jgi:cold shock CspA family protein
MSQIIAVYDGGLVQFPPGNRRKQRQQLHSLAWYEAAAFFGIQLQEQTQKLSAEGLRLLGEQQGINVDVESISMKKNEFYETLSSGLPVTAVLQKIRSQLSANLGAKLFVIGRKRSQLLAGIRKLQIETLVTELIACDDQKQSGESTPQETEAVWHATFVRAIQVTGVPPQQCTVYVGSDRDVQLARSFNLGILDVRTLPAFVAVDSLTPFANAFVEMKNPRIGVCVSYNYKRGFGFLEPVGEGKLDANQVFVHQSTIHSQGFRSLDVGSRYLFEEHIAADGRRKTRIVTALDRGYCKRIANVRQN